MIFEWMSDPSAWIGLATLVVLEIVLGIDNLVFIAILAEKLPPEQRNTGRIVGLILALVMKKTIGFYNRNTREIMYPELVKSDSDVEAFYEKYGLKK